MALRTGNELLDVYLEEYTSLRYEADMHYQLLYDLQRYSILALPGLAAVLGFVLESQNLWTMLFFAIPIALFGLMANSEPLRVGQVGQYVQDTLRLKVESVPGPGVSSEDPIWRFVWYKSPLRKEYLAYDLTAMVPRACAHNALYFGTVLGIEMVCVVSRPQTPWQPGEILLVALRVLLACLVAVGGSVSGFLGPARFGWMRGPTR